MIKVEESISQLIEVCKNIYNRQLISGKSGNVSVRLGDYIAITPTLKSLNNLKEEDIGLVDSSKMECGLSRKYFSYNVSVSTSST